MPNVTENYGLKKPLADEFYDVNVQNENMDVIDAQLKLLSEDSGVVISPDEPETGDVWIDTDDESGSSGGVTSVNGKTGDVNLTASDLDAYATGQVYTKTETNNLVNAITPASIGAEPVGLSYGRYVVSSGTDEDFISTIDSVYATMSDFSARHIVVSLSKVHPVLGGGTTLVKIYRADANYGTMSCTLYTSSGGDMEYKRARSAGTWGSFATNIHTSNILTYATPANIGAATTKTYTATVSTGWTASGNYFYKDVTVSGILATDNPVVDINAGSDNAANALYSESICKVFRITTSANSIRLWATEAIAQAFPIQLKVVR